MMEAKARGEGYKIDKLRRNIEMDEYDSFRGKRSIAQRYQFGGISQEASFGKDQYDPTSPLYQYDYWGEPKNSEISKQERMKDAHNKSIVGKGNVWYDMSYDDAIKQTIERRKDGSNVVSQKEEEEGDDDEYEFDYSILSDESSIGYSEQQPLVNGTQVFTDSSLDGG